MVGPYNVNELPSVNFSGQLYHDTTALLDVLPETIDFDLPGLGITHSSPLGLETSQKENHRWDRVVLINALQQLSPRNFLHLPISPSVKGLYLAGNIATLEEGTPPHYDAEERVVAIDGLIMVLRLHTADNHNGAHIKLVNAYSGRTGFATGDSSIFKPGHDSPEAISRGYDMLRRIDSYDLMAEAMYGKPDPLLVDPEIFTFEQTPGSSVLFRTNCSFGPKSGHEFKPIDPSQPRIILTSDVQLYSHPPQYLDEHGEPDIRHLADYYCDAVELVQKALRQAN